MGFCSGRLKSSPKNKHPNPLIALIPSRCQSPSATVATVTHRSVTTQLDPSVQLRVGTKSMFDYLSKWIPISSGASSTSCACDLDRAADLLQSFDFLLLILVPVSLLLSHQFLSLLQFDIFLSANQLLHQAAFQSRTARGCRRLMLPCVRCFCCISTPSLQVPAAWEHKVELVWFEDQINDVSKSLIIGIQKQLKISQKYYGCDTGSEEEDEAAREFRTVPVIPVMFSARRAIIEETQPRQETSMVASEQTRKINRDRTRTGSAGMTTAKRSVKFVEHAPLIFHNLRMLYGIEEIDIGSSFHIKQSSFPEKDQGDTESNGSGGRGGRDGRVVDPNVVTGQSGSYDTTASVDDMSRASSSSSGGRSGGGRESGGESKNNQKHSSNSSSSSSSNERERDRSSSSTPEKSAGKSAAVFIRSNDGRLLLKTLNEEERNQLLGGNMLSLYYTHMEKYRTTTLLPWFLGCYTMYREGSNFPPVSVIMMSVRSLLVLLYF